MLRYKQIACQVEECNVSVNDNVSIGNYLKAFRGDTLVLKTNSASSAKMSVTIYQSTLRQISEDFNLKHFVFIS